MSIFDIKASLSFSVALGSDLAATSKGFASSNCGTSSATTGTVLASELTDSGSRASATFGFIVPSFSLRKWFTVPLNIESTT